MKNLSEHPKISAILRKLCCCHKHHIGLLELICLNLISESEGMELSNNDIVEHTGGSHSHVAWALRKLKASGCLEQIKTGRFSKWRLMPKGTEYIGIFGFIDPKLQPRLAILRHSC